MTLLIVDDEYYLVQGVKNAISWADYGIDTVLEAYSAEQALARFAEQKIDIMLADVEMPREIGLSLIRKVVERGYGSINILLTGHANFNYAKEAIQLKVFDYLLKPVEIPQLTQVIGKACDELERQRKESMAAEQVLQEQTTEEMIPEEDAGEESFGLVEQVRLYIDQNMEDPAMDRKSIAEAVHLNPDYLSFLFHKETGKVLSSYITEKRIELAKKLLVTTDRTLAEIGEQAGFSNNPYFHRQFKKLTGMTPTTYREQNRRKS